MVTMRASVLSVQRDDLTVFDHDMHQEVVVHTPHACFFCEGDYLCIRYSGAMTMSIPPQISATNICIIPRSRPRHGFCR